MTTTLAPKPELQAQDTPSMIHIMDIGATRARGCLVALCGYKAKESVRLGELPVDCIVCIELWEAFCDSH